MARAKTSAALQRRFANWRNRTSLAANAVLAAEAEEIARAARANVMAGRHGAGGSALANSIAVVGPRVVAAAAFAKFIEFGTARRPARPFLVPAFRQRKAVLQNAVRRVIALLLMSF